VAEVCRTSGVLPKWIYKAVVSANTCMHHLLLGIDPSHVGWRPTRPVMRHAAVLPARELLLKIAPEARVCLLPLVAGFVGADAVAVALARGWPTRPRYAWPSTSAPTARSCWARASACSPARPRRAPR